MSLCALVFVLQESVVQHPQVCCEEWTQRGGYSTSQHQRMQRDTPRSTSWWLGTVTVLTSWSAPARYDCIDCVDYKTDDNYQGWAWVRPILGMGERRVLCKMPVSTWLQCMTWRHFKCQWSHTRSPYGLLVTPTWIASMKCLWRNQSVSAGTWLPAMLASHCSLVSPCCHSSVWQSPSHWSLASLHSKP